MKTLILLILVLITSSLSAAAQNASTDSAELTRMLNEFLSGAGRNDAEIHDRFWDEDLIYTGSGGRRISKAELMRGVRSTKPPKPEDPSTVYSAEDVRILQYGNAAIVAFILVATTTEKDGKKRLTKFFNTGTFIKRDGRWRAVAWQATSIPELKQSPGE